MNIKCSDELRRATSGPFKSADIMDRNHTLLHPRSYCTSMLASIHAETQSDRVAEACSKVVEMLAVLGEEVKTASKLVSTLVKTGQCNIPLSGALPLSYVPARVTRCALLAHRHSFAPPRCRTSQYRRIFVPFSVSLFNDLSDPVFDDAGLAGFKSRVNAFLLA